jgi:HK97 family phage major capsid protein
MRAASGRGASNTLGQCLQTVARASQDPSGDYRLVRVPHGLSESDPTAGGFLLPTEFVGELQQSIYGEAVIAPLCRTIDLDKFTSAGAKLPAVDEQSRADGSRWGGSISSWLAEADQGPRSLPRWRDVTLKPNKLVSLITVSAELLADGRLLEEHLRTAVTAEFSFQLDRAILRGSGHGTPAGILSSPGLITADTTAAQTAATLSAANINSMWGRLPAPSRRRATWLLNEDSLGQLDAGNGTSSGVSFTGIYAPAGTSADDMPRLKGRGPSN